MGTLIRLGGWIACALVGLGFIAFAADELDRGSKNQQQALQVELENGQASPAALAPDGEQAREAQHGQLREAIDDANDVLLAPFQDVVSSSNTWVDHGVPALLGLLLYGVGLGLLANFLPKQRRAGVDDWRTA